MQNTDLELMQQALEKLKFFSHMKSVSEDTMRLITALRERLARPAFTTGHCENHKQKGGCPLHNLQCGWPECDRKAAEPARQEQEPAVKQSLTVQDSVAWADRAMELATDFAIESLRLGSYERKDTYENSSRASWQTVDLRSKREEARERLRRHLYTAPQPAQQPLTEEEINSVVDEVGLSPHAVARAVEAAHGITGVKQ